VSWSCRSCRSRLEGSGRHRHTEVGALRLRAVGHIEAIANLGSRKCWVSRIRAIAPQMLGVPDSRPVPDSRRIWGYANVGCPGFGRFVGCPGFGPVWIRWVSRIRRFVGCPGFARAEALPRNPTVDLTGKRPARSSVRSGLWRQSPVALRFHAQILASSSRASRGRLLTIHC